MMYTLPNAASVIKEFMDDNEMTNEQIIRRLGVNILTYKKILNNDSVNQVVKEKVLRMFPEISAVPVEGRTIYRNQSSNTPREISSTSDRFQEPANILQLQGILEKYLESIKGRWYFQFKKLNNEQHQRIAMLIGKMHEVASQYHVISKELDDILKIETEELQPSDLTEPLEETHHSEQETFEFVR